jgi:hypothetical protein
MGPVAADPLRMIAAHDTLLGSIPHTNPDFLWSFVGSLDFISLSLKLTTGFADPRGDETGRDHSPPQAHADGVPHVRTSVRGLIKTGGSPIKGLSFSLSCNRHRIIGSPANGLFLLRKAHTWPCTEPRSKKSGSFAFFAKGGIVKSHPFISHTSSFVH